MNRTILTALCIWLGGMQMVWADMMSDVVHYYELGVHRTGTRVDYMTSNWLESRLGEAGLKTERQAWTIRQYFLQSAEVQAGDEHLDVFPIWYSPATGDDGLSGKLVTVDTPGCERCDPSRIGFIANDHDRRWWATFRREVVDQKKLEAVIAISYDRSPYGLIQAQNVRPEDVGKDLTIPVLLAHETDKAIWQRLTTKETPVTVRLKAATDDDTRGYNVIGIKEGGPKWVVVSTPASGWFQCAGERGPGVALLLALADWVGQRDTRFSYLFTANSGHELGFWGARQIHESGLLPMPEDTVAWLHLGASIATPVWREHDDGYSPDEKISRGNLQVTDDAFIEILERSFSDIEPLQPTRLTRLVGELANASEHGYKGFGLVGGGNIFFHTRRDTPRTVSRQSLSDVLDALKKTFMVLEERDR